MFGIYHMYDVDGGFGDAVTRDDLIALCDDEKMANEYAERFNATHVYDTPYADLYCGELEVRDLNNLIVITKDNEHTSPWDSTIWPENNGYIVAKNNTAEVEDRLQLAENTKDTKDKKHKKKKGKKQKKKK